MFLAALFTGLSWRNIHQLKQELFARSMIRYKMYYYSVLNIIRRLTFLTGVINEGIQYSSKKGLPKKRDGLLSLV